MEYTIAGYEFYTVTAKNLEEPVFITPAFSYDTLIKLATIYVDKNSRFWPDDLPAFKLVENLKVFYVPLLIRTGRASASWSASVGKYYDSQTSWSQQSGVVSTDAENEIVENYDMADFNISTRLGLRENGSLRGGTYWDEAYKYLKFKAENPLAACIPLSQSQRDEIEVLRPKLNKAQALENTKKELRTRLEHKAEDYAKLSIKGDTVRGLSLAYEHIEGLSVSTWLSPIYIGSYIYKDSNYSLSIAANGYINLHDVPSRGGECLFIILTIILALIPAGIVLANNFERPNWLLVGVVYTVSCFIIWWLLGIIHIRMRKRSSAIK